MGTRFLLTLLLIQLVASDEYLTNEDDSSLHSSEIPETELLKTESRRQARQLNIPSNEYRGYTQRQIIKIPNSNGARVKVLTQPPQHHQQQQRLVRGTRVANGNGPPVGPPNNQQHFFSSQNHNHHHQPPPHQQQQFPPYQNQQTRPRQQQKQLPKRPFEEDEYPDEEYRAPKKPRKTKNGYMVDVSPEEFYEEEEDVYSKKQKKPYSYVQTGKQAKKKARKPEIHHETSHFYDTSPQASTPQRRPVFDEETGYEFNRIRHRDRSPAPTTYFDDYNYDDYTSQSAISMMQVPPPNLAFNSIDHPVQIKESHSVKKQMNSEHYERYPTEPTPLRKPPVTRQMQPDLPQHYTTHNPYVTRNLGFEDHERAGYFGEHSGMDEPATAPSELRPVLLPTGSSGIHIVKPPQFRNNAMPATAMPPHNQRATIRDILKEDCPDAEGLGFCASPPRYPTQQTNQVMSKCAEMLEAMYSPAPADPEDDLSSFSSRSDEQDIEFIDDEPPSTNTSQIVAEWPQWSRSDLDVSSTVCSSILTQTEPGYAKEVTSGRWFVIMQTMDAIVQRIMTDTCQRPGKPCAGLAGLKCSRMNDMHHGYKSTRCVQRHTQHRLVSWDPETPHACPKVRVFRFPTACLCHID